MSLIENSGQEKKKQIHSRVIETKPLKWSEFQFIQESDFKTISEEARQKIRDSIIQHEFSQPFYVWQDPADNVIYCLDGYHRIQELRLFSEQDYEVPELLPATLIRCSDKQDAARLVLQYSSMYAKVSETGILNFMEAFNLDPKDLEMTVDLPGINLSIDEQEMKDPFADDGVGIKNQYGVIVMCVDEPAQQKVFNQLTAGGYNCKVVVT